MKITGFRSFDFPTGVKCGIPAHEFPFPTVRHTMIQRVGAAAAFGSAVIPERYLPVQIVVTDLAALGFANYENAFSWILTQLRPTDPTPGELRGLRKDGTAVTLAAVMNLLPGFQTSIQVISAQFVLADPFWVATTESTESKTFNKAARDISFAVTISADAEVPAKLRVQPTAQRAAPTVGIGWKYKVVKTIALATANAEPLVKFPVFIDLGDTAALVSGGKAQADGDDVIVVIDGVQVPRTLRNWNNTTNSGVWINIPHLPAGSSMDLEIWYGNASATAPATLATVPSGSTQPTNLPAIVLASSLNTSWVYATDDTAGNAGLGGWGLSSGTIAPTADFDRPGAWSRDTTCPNRDNNDDFAQKRYTEYVATGTKYRAVFDSERSRTGGRDPADNQEADGVVLHHPLGIDKINVGFAWLNEYASGSSGNPVGQLVVLHRTTAAEEWVVTGSDNTVDTTPTTIAAADYNPAATVKEMACAVWPYDGVAVVKTARKNRRVAASWNTDLTVTIDTSNLSITTTTAETEIYEMSTDVTIHEDGRQRRWRQIRLGGISGRRLGVPLNNILVVRPDERRVEEWNSTLTTLVRIVPPPAYQLYQGIVKADGVASIISSDAWPALHEVTNPLPNPDFASGITGWSILASGAGMTTALSHVSNKLRLTISPSTASAAAECTVQATQLIPLNGRKWVTAAMDLATSDIDLEPDPSIWWYDATPTLLSRSDGADWVASAAETVRRIVAAAPPVGATQYRVGFTVTDNAGSQTGTIDVDTVRVNGPELVVTDDALGTVVLTNTYFASYP